jgi:hypothetical protein
MNAPSVEMLHRLLICDAENGKLFWRHRGVEWFKDSDRHSASVYCDGWNTKNAGREALVIESSGYRTGRILGKKVPAHRIIWAMHHGCFPLGVVDHKNGNTLDNRIVNLRSVTQAENTRNAKLRRDNSSGVLGVGMVKSGRWRARLTCSGQKIILGTFDTLEQAAAARKAADVKHGFFPEHGRSA